MTPSMTASVARQMAARWSAKTSALWSKTAVRSGLAVGPKVTHFGNSRRWTHILASAKPASHSILGNRGFRYGCRTSSGLVCHRPFPELPSMVNTKGYADNLDLDACIHVHTEVTK